MEGSLNKFGPFLFIAVHLSTGIYGLLYAMPKLYQNLNLQYMMQGIVCYGLIQVMICWYITRRVDSSYQTDGKPFSIPTFALEHGLIARGPNVPMESLSQGNEIRNEHGRAATVAMTTSRTLVSSGDSRSSHGHQNAFGFQLLVAVEVNGVRKKRPFSYWSWIPCDLCQSFRPPRCHHCILCQKCILKRDHHCYFTGTCVGGKNQGHFIVFTFWSAFVTSFGTLHMFPFVYFEMLPVISFFDFLPPVSISRAALGYVTVDIPFLCAMFWALLIFTALSIFMFYEILNVTTRGATSFELSNMIKVTDCRSVSQRWCDLLGENWLLSFLFPYAVLTSSKEDAVLWPHVKP